MTATTDNSQDMIVDFVDEGVDSLRDVPELLNSHRLNPGDDGPINGVFRSVHSIKGCAGFLGLTAIKQFSHSLENTMDEIRKGKLTLSEPLQECLIQGIDLLESMLGRALDGELESQVNSEESELLSQIETLISDCLVDLPPEEELLAQITALSEEIAQSDHPQAADWSERVQVLVKSYRGEEADSEDTTPSDPRPADFVNAACRCGETDVSTQIAALLEMFLAADQGNYSDELAEGFLGAAESFAATAQAADNASLAEALQAAAGDLRTIVDSPLDVDATLLSVVWDHLWPELTQLEGASGKTEAEEETAESEDSADDEPEQGAAVEAAPKAAKARLVRVKEEYVDGFLNDVSSLFITCELLKDLQSRMSQDNSMPTLVEEMRQINTAFNAQSAALQQSVVALRRVAVSGLFSKVPRMARGLAKQLDKKVDVVMRGEETEVDKSLVEDLDAPLNHMIRNSLDHGIETPDERKARGVSETGTLTLGAELTRTHVVITIDDDGRGIDPVKMRDNIVKKGAMSREEADALSDQEAVELIFHAGFSTAKEVSDVSGRGVGMDVVRTNLQEHNGEVNVTSKVGVGTTFRMQIPIREAVLVIDGLMIRQSGETFALPFEHILEITEIDPTDLKQVQGSYVATVRGKTCGAVYLSEILGLDADPSNQGKHLQAVLVGCKLGEICLLVDEVQGHRQIVLNSINDILPDSDKIAGVAQLGGGRLALVLSVEDIVRTLKENKQLG